MKAISVVPGSRTIRLVDRDEPSISLPDQIKLRVLRVGICGTDREEAAGGRAKAPPSRQDLVLGHKMFGQVIETGRGVKQVKPGDYAVCTVRRGCGKCQPCAMNRSDMCQTGLYSERGISGLMMESFLAGGRQELSLGHASELTYGQSITDACLAWDDTAPLLDELASAVRARR